MPDNIGEDDSKDLIFFSIEVSTSRQAWFQACALVHTVTLRMNHFIGGSPCCLDVG